MRLVLLASFALVAGCAVAQDLDPIDVPTDGAPAEDGRVERDSAPVDASVADTATPGPDTTVSDTTVADTATASDTFVADTAKADTAKADTAVADTASTDTGGVLADGGCAIQGCATGSQDRLTCATARTIARRTAGPLGGYNATVPMGTASIYDTTSITCIAAGFDHAYKLFMRKGEVVTATAGPSTGSAKYSVVMFEGGDCATNSCATAKKCAAGSTLLTASADGWVTIVVSGQTPFDLGSYSIKVTLSGCASADCECP